jgi:TctA family transporter
MALGSGGFWKAVLIVAALALAIETVALKLDVRDWRLEFARMSLFLIIVPWIAGGRKRHLRKLLQQDRQDP